MLVIGHMAHVGCQFLREMTFPNSHLGNAGLCYEVHEDLCAKRILFWFFNLYNIIFPPSGAELLSIPYWLVPGYSLLMLSCPAHTQGMPASRELAPVRQVQEWQWVEEMQNQLTSW